MYFSIAKPATVKKHCNELKLLDDRSKKVRLNLRVGDQSFPNLLIDLKFVVFQWK